MIDTGKNKPVVYSAKHNIIICFFCAGVSFGTAANEFYLGFLQSYSPSDDQPQLLVSTSETFPVEFTVETAFSNISYSVTDGTTTVVEISWEYQVEVTETGITHQGIHLKAEPGKKVTVRGLSVYGGTYSAFPCSHIPGIEEYEYYAITYNSAESSQRPHNGYDVDDGSTVLLVGCEDNTTITIDDSTIVTLNRLQTYLHHEPTTRRDLTGARYTSSKPISVISGHPCTYVPSGIEFCDSLMEQIPPTAIWGTSFLSKSYEGRASGEIYRALAAYSSTVVNVSCNITSASLILEAKGSWKEFRTPAYSYCSIESNRPVIVMEFMLGSQLDSNAKYGDPLMMMLSPIDQYSNHYNLRAVPGYTSYVTVYVPPQFFQPQSIIMNGFSLQDKEWTPISCSRDSAKYCGYVASQQVSSGDFQLYHSITNARIGVTVHGLDVPRSYGYIGGLEVQTSKFFCLLCDISSTVLCITHALLCCLLW